MAAIEHLYEHTKAIYEASAVAQHMRVQEWAVVHSLQLCLTWQAVHLLQCPSQAVPVPCTHCLQASLVTCQHTSSRTAAEFGGPNRYHYHPVLQRLSM